jgi:hypothetical protein
MEDFRGIKYQETVRDEPTPGAMDSYGVVEWEIDPELPPFTSHFNRRCGEDAEFARGLIRKLLTRILPKDQTK